MEAGLTPSEHLDKSKLDCGICCAAGCFNETLPTVRNGKFEMESLPHYIAVKLL